MLVVCFWRSGAARGGGGTIVDSGPAGEAPQTGSQYTRCAVCWSRPFSCGCCPDTNLPGPQNNP
eukprot:1049084-Alexandrium_andersonii.AAC.1